jgi:hypothetical protein
VPTFKKRKKWCYLALISNRLRRLSSPKIYNYQGKPKSASEIRLRLLWLIFAVPLLQFCTHLGDSAQTFPGKRMLLCGNGTHLRKTVAAADWAVRLSALRFAFPLD